MLDRKKMIQCNSCLENLNEFLKILDKDYAFDIEDLLVDYTIFCEARRLKEQQTKAEAKKRSDDLLEGLIKSPAPPAPDHPMWPTPRIHPYGDSPLTVTC